MFLKHALLVIFIGLWMKGYPSKSSLIHMISAKNILRRRKQNDEVLSPTQLSGFLRFVTRGNVVYKPSRRFS
nr:MAG TPA: hypothetical protein [Caudoviricetes sp.]